VNPFWGPLKHSGPKGRNQRQGQGLGPFWVWAHRVVWTGRNPGLELGGKGLGIGYWDSGKNLRKRAGGKGPGGPGAPRRPKVP